MRSVVSPFVARYDAFINFSDDMDAHIISQIVII